MEGDKATNFVTKHWEIVSAVCVILFALGGLYAENKSLTNEVKNMKETYEHHLIDAERRHNELIEKQERKWGDIPEIEQRVDDLEEWKAYLEGKENLPDR